MADDGVGLQGWRAAQVRENQQQQEQLLLFYIPQAKQSVSSASFDKRQRRKRICHLKIVVVHLAVVRVVLGVVDFVQQLNCQRPGETRLPHKAVLEPQQKAHKKQVLICN